MLYCLICVVAINNVDNVGIFRLTRRLRGRMMGMYIQYKAHIHRAEGLLDTDQQFSIESNVTH